LVSDLGGAIARDPEVRQARTIAEAARTRLVASVTGPQEKFDLVEAQGMLEALTAAQVLAEAAEDRVLVHRGLLTSAEADRRAAKRRPAVTRRDEQPRPAVRRGRRAGVLLDLRASRLRVPVAAPRPGGRRNAARLIAGALTLALLGVVGATLAERYGVRLPLTRR
jgi:hypothetical protein